MRRLNMIVEGQTEETFVRQTVAPYLAEKEIIVSVRCVETGRKRNRISRGGMTSYIKAKNDIIRWMKEDHNAWFTTMFDLYALPNDFPGMAISNSNPLERARYIENGILSDIGVFQNTNKFIPYIQVHEFETLLLSFPEKLSTYFFGPEYEQAIKDICDMCSEFDSVEYINCGRETSPSKRIISFIPEYDGLKTTAGPEIAKEIGMEYLMKKCLHFKEWVEKLSSI